MLAAAPESPDNEHAMLAFLWMTALLSAGAAVGIGDDSDAPSDVPKGNDSLFSRLDTNGDGRVERSEVTANQALFDRLLRRADRDGDGVLTADELARGLRPAVQPKPIEQAKPERYGATSDVKVLLLKLDTDRDTRLTRHEAPEELRKAYDELVREFDANKDGVLDPRELTLAAGRLQRVAQRIAQQQRWDTTAELARLERSQGELADRFDKPPTPNQVLGDPARARAMFAQLDANGDGKLARDELPEPLRNRLGPMFARADRNGDGALSKSEFLAAVDRLAKLQRRIPAAAPKPSNAPPSK